MSPRITRAAARAEETQRIQRIANLAELFHPVEAAAGVPLPLRIIRSELHSNVVNTMAEVTASNELAYETIEQRLPEDIQGMEACRRRIEEHLDLYTNRRETEATAAAAFMNAAADIESYNKHDSLINSKFLCGILITFVSQIVKLGERRDQLYRCLVFPAPDALPFEVTNQLMAFSEEVLRVYLVDIEDILRRIDRLPGDWKPPFQASLRRRTAHMLVARDGDLYVSISLPDAPQLAELSGTSQALVRHNASATTLRVTVTILKG